VGLCFQDVVKEAEPLAELEHNVEVQLVLERLMHPDDVRVIPHIFEEHDLPLQGL